jgi:DNA-binding transcriptional ArsR family regulator
MSDKLTLDRETFKVLSADTRIDILKRLEQRKKTLTDLAQEMGMSPSTIKEHLDKLVSAGLIKHIDRGTKWKYYCLTHKGSMIINPVETKVWILLGVSVLLLAASMLSLHAGLMELVYSQAFAAAPPTAERAVAEESAAGGRGEGMMLAAPRKTSDVVQQDKEEPPAVETLESEQKPAPTVALKKPSIPYGQLAAVLLFTLTSGVCIGYILKKRRGFTG